MKSKFRLRLESSSYRVLSLGLASVAFWSAVSAVAQPPPDSPRPVVPRVQAKPKGKPQSSNNATVGGVPPPTQERAPGLSEPPGAAPALPTNMEKIVQATDVPYKPKPAGHLVKFNLQDADLAELVNHISGLTGKRFIYGSKVRQIKATVVSPESVTLEEAYQAFLSILEANGMTVVPHGRFLKIVDTGGVVSQPTPVVSRGEPIPESDRVITRLYRLDHISADEAMQLLNKFKSKDGDISVYGPGRLLIVTDTASQIRRLVRIIEEIDVGGSGQHMWIEPLMFGSAPELARRLTELFEIGAPPPPPGTPVSPARAVGLSKVLADEPTNSLIVVGTEDSYLRLLEVLKRLDMQAGSNNDQVHVLPLQHASAEELATTVSQMLGPNQQQRQGAAKVVGNPGATFEGEVRVTADKRTNSLIVTSSDRDYAALRLVLDKLDKPRRQVFIEAVIMDLTVSDSLNLGASFHGGSMLGANNDQLLLGGFQGGKSIGFPVDPALLQGFAAGIRGPQLPGTQNLLGNGVSIPAFGVVLNTIASSGRSNILATPHLIATDNVQAEISIGENIPLQTNIGGGLPGLPGQPPGAPGMPPGFPGFGFGFSAPRQDVGNRIKVTPHINESDQVRLEIDQESSAQGAASGALGAVSITKRTVRTSLVVQDQETVVIGGLVKDEYVNSRDKIPVLGDLPVLGAIFRQSKIEKRKANLLLILTPHVLRDQGDLRRVFEQRMQERQEFLDRHFVFSDENWRPPRDWSRTNGLVEDIRKAYAEIEEGLKLEEESRSLERRERAPSAPIELPARGKTSATVSGETSAVGATSGAAVESTGKVQRNAVRQAPVLVPNPASSPSQRVGAASTAVTPVYPPNEPPRAPSSPPASSAPIPSGPPPGSPPPQQPQQPLSPAPSPAPTGGVTPPTPNPAPNSTPPTEQGLLLGPLGRPFYRALGWRRGLIRS